MTRSLASVLAGALAVALVTMLVPSAASAPAGRTTAHVHAAGTPGPESPPPPALRSHRVRIDAAPIGFCTREQVESPDGCVFPAIFHATRKLPVHPGGRVLVNTRIETTDLTVGLFCGSTRPARQVGPRRWVFRINREQGTRRTCDGGQMDVTYGEGTGFDGGVARYTFSTKPHGH